jgi:hypothetical protein
MEKGQAAGATRHASGLITIPANPESPAKKGMKG